MLSIQSSVRIFRASEPVDFRKGFDGLCAIVRDHFGDDPLSGHLFLFFNRRRDRIKILVWDQNGFWILDSQDSLMFCGHGPNFGLRIGVTAWLKPNSLSNPRSVRGKSHQGSQNAKAARSVWWPFSIGLLVSGEEAP